MKCRWCSNPESQSFSPELMYHGRLCIACGRCVAICTQNALALTSEGIRIDRNQCNLCKECAEHCPAGAICVAGEEFLIDRIMNRVEEDRDYYETSGGGVTLTGGEPLAQPGAAAALLKKCRKEGWHTAVETCGHVRQEIFHEIGSLVDLFLFDLKAVDPGLHEAGTGVDNRLIRSNLEALIRMGARVVLRVPLIPEFNLTDAFCSDLARLIRETGVIRVDLIPYHRLGLAKYEALSRSSPLEDASPVEEKRLRRFRDCLMEKTTGDVRIEN